eukprot:m.189684 g.189684  ORF g.189684 m.189684 type:complete len:97 (+) comp14798_c0_seq7:884-1174(+)
MSQQHLTTVESCTCNVDACTRSPGYHAILAQSFFSIETQAETTSFTAARVTCNLCSALTSKCTCACVFEVTNSPDNELSMIANESTPIVNIYCTLY